MNCNVMLAIHNEAALKVNHHSRSNSLQFRTLENFAKYGATSGLPHESAPLPELSGESLSNSGVCSPRLKQDPKVWEEGFKAGQSRIRTPTQCPYAAGTAEAWSWYSGYIEGAPGRLGIIRAAGLTRKGRRKTKPSFAGQNAVSGKMIFGAQKDVGEIRSGIFESVERIS
jgi:hypothetical protein